MYYLAHTGNSKLFEKKNLIMTDLLFLFKWLKSDLNGNLIKVYNETQTLNFFIFFNSNYNHLS